jgi:hypothetical protein
VHGHSWPTRRELTGEVFESIEVLYNRTGRLKDGQLDSRELLDAIEHARANPPTSPRSLNASRHCAAWTAVAEAATVPGAMTAKERLRERIEALSEEEAGEALRLLDQREDPVIAAFRDAPEDDEPWTRDDEAAAAEGRADIAAGRTVSLDDAMREFE